MTRRLVVLVTVVATLLGACSLGLALRYPGTPDGEQPPLGNALWGSLWLALGVVVVWHRQREILGYLMLGFGAMICATSMVQVISVQDSAESCLVLVTLVSRAGGIMYVLLGVGAGLLIHLFPTGRPPSPGWRWPVRALVVSGFAVSAGVLIGVDPTSQGPLVKAATAAVTLGYALGLLSAIPSLAYRVWRSKGAERAQMKWFLLAVVIAAVAWFFDRAPAPVTFLCVVVLPPLAITIALLRYRLYDIDRVISRTASYAIVTGLLVATYGVIVTAVTRLLPTSSTLAVATATLAAAALARPVYRRVQGAVDRRFNRARYQAQLTIDAFGARLRNEVDSDNVARDLAGVVSQTLQPSGITLWVRGGA